MFTKLFDDWFSDKTFRYTQEQREAVLDILLLIAHADGRLTVEEQVELERTEERIGWEGGTPLSAFITGAEQRIAALNGDREQVEAYIVDEMAHLHSDYLARKLYDLCEKLAGADQHIDPAEAFILEIVRRCQRV